VLLTVSTDFLNISLLFIIIISLSYSTATEVVSIAAWTVELSVVYSCLECHCVN